jgi:hypothetical protein
MSSLQPGEIEISQDVINFIRAEQARQGKTDAAYVLLTRDSSQRGYAAHFAATHAAAVRLGRRLGGANAPILSLDTDLELRTRPGR